MSLQFYQQLLKPLQTGDLAIATVMKTTGSVPREVGAKMALCADGTLLDTIGGGAGEAKVLSTMENVLASGDPQKVNIDLSGAVQRVTEGVCGGQMQVWVAKWSGEAAIMLITRILDRLNQGHTVRLFTPFAPGFSPHLLSLNSPQPSPQSGFIDLIEPPPLLLIIGAGHVGEKLAQVTTLLGFQVVIQDDRPQWANPERFPSALAICTDSITPLLDQWPYHHPLYIAMVTRGYDYDLEALRSLLQNNLPYRYIGMIGSVKRVNKVRKALADYSIPLDKLNRIYAPIGLDIGALTPAEIAISIGAELVLVQRGGTGLPLSQANH
ncbi:MAG: XdhC family protein [Roseofilum sp. SBFL]|uniref:XdhC family protein n=1 Tax=unclassified Roseofilum TaxID=2620099 RepID=UPI001B078C30|nr:MULTISPECIES: XdhC family protein [unclassified Roseofilum]MBP0014922.1 XdhC family protein [Roseofilum sp. SID3]MBP0025926.1 XdhC family protein [Roseofilum sp. SID2]MBP0038501.1 XdhC family protein [Roseofilum sp. SID1]MBP0041997.1 XdhC family protein [Roseofilum sp. SBFL]